MVEILDKELDRLYKKRHEARKNYDDTGHNRYWKIINECDKKIDEINKLIKDSSAAALKEFNIINMMTDIKQKAANLRLDYPHDEGLLKLQNYINSRVEIWTLEK